MKNTRFSKIFRRFLISYMIILLLPLISGLISYRVFMETAEEHSIEKSNQALQESKDIVEQRMLSVERFGRQVAMNSELITLLNRNVSDNRTIVYSLRQLSNDISPFTQTNDFLENFYIYFKNSDIIVAPNNVYFRPEQFYSFNRFENVEYEDWKSLILQSQNRVIPSTDYVTDDIKTEVITFIQPLPLDSYPEPSGALVVPIEQNKMNAMLESIPEQFNGWSYILNQDEEILASTGIGERDIESLTSKIDEESTVQKLDDGTLMMTLTSEGRDWTYVAGVPEVYLESQAKPIKTVTWTVTGATIFIGIIICLLFAYRQSRPITALVQVIREQSDNEKVGKLHNEYDFLNSNISSIISKNSNLQEQIENQKPLLKETFCKQLLSGKLNRSKGSIHTVAEQAGISLSGERGYIAILKIQGYGEMVNQEIYEELTAARIIIRKESEELMSHLLMTDLHSDKLVYIFLGSRPPEESAENIQELFTALSERLYKNYRMTFKVGIGNFFSELTNISRSYDEAKQTVDYASLVENNGVYWHKDIDTESSIFYYPLDYEVRFLKALKDGEAEEAKRTLHDIFVENFEKRTLSPEMTAQLFHELKGTFLRASDQMILNRKENTNQSLDQLWNIETNDTADRIKHFLHQCIEEFCELVNERKKNATTSEVRIIKQFLHENYSDPNVTIYSIAEQVGRPEKYVSQLFHEQTNEYLSDYLENIRIEEAKHLLATTSKKIAEIADDVGYNSPHSFRRAFKRVAEVTPNQYRNTTNQ
ncbi:helix-turn-helix domain-containing protein [Alteribacillus sp. HJP-4]|uniref:helix-turn-helix domain-containing protein n=1 Tax=Alteribacillus sp. HJP-4 TaxID=2775394 RepID=UPI0035CD2AEA